MRYDDRLATVLRLPVNGGNMARVQLRQLLDLLGTAPAVARSDMLDAAYLRLTQLCAHTPAPDCSALLAEPGLRLRSPRLLATLANAEPSVLRTALHAAQLDEAVWLDLIPALPSRAWSMLWERRDLGPRARALLARLGGGRIALPLAPEPAEDAAAAPSFDEHPVDLGQFEGPEPGAAWEQPVTPEPEPLTPALPPERPGWAWHKEPVAEIGAIVRRIEAFRRAREAGGHDLAPQTMGNPAPIASDAPRLPLGDEPLREAPAAFDFETDSDGRIIRADAAIAPMVAGLELADTAALESLIQHRQPIRGATARLDGAPAIAGEWHLDATPRFDALGGGRFIGYLGRFRRLSPTRPPLAAVAQDSESERLRQLLHELRTPVNAIQGFAEIIQQQLFGPTPHEYRALAAVIAADAARMLAGFEELERFARIDSGATEIAGGESDLAACVASALARLEQHTTTRGISLELDGEADGGIAALPVGLAEIETERLCWRLLATLAATATAGETLHLRLHRAGVVAGLELQLPAALAGMTDAALFHASVDIPADAPSAGMFGTGFTLRLAGVEARAAGGSLVRDGARLLLTLPLRILPDLTENAASHSDAAGGMRS
jgi:signal transduction histidine kinase